MLINWFTVGAQVVNFLILVWLMRRYLYRPILAAIDARAKQVASVLAEADSKMSDAAKQLSAFQEKTKGFDDDRARRMAAVDEEVKNERERMMQSAKQDGDAARLAESADLHNHQTSFASQLSKMIESEVFALSRKVIADLANADLEHQIVIAFIKQLDAFDRSAGSPLVDALKQSGDTAVVNTSRAISEADTEALRNAINSLAGTPVSTRFDTTAANICGIALSCAGQRAGWSVEDYLGQLNATTASLLNQSFPPQAPEAPLVGKAKAKATTAEQAANDSAALST